MLQYFPKIQYPFDGGTFEVTDIFRSINLVFDREDAVFTTQSLPGERPDQLSNRIYNDPQFYWSLFLTNGVRNPLREWAQTPESYNEQIELEYSGWEYQFANVSDFLPMAGVTGFTGTVLEGYTGTNLDGIVPGDLVIYETGSGPLSIKCYGAGLVYSEDVCGSPHFGQSIVPDEFTQQKNIVQVSAGNHFTACLDSKGYIYAWGKDVGLAGVYIPATNEYTGQFKKFGNLYKSKLGGYSFIDAAGDRLFAIKNSALDCFGNDCDDYSAYYQNETGITYTSWTNDISGGVAIKTDGTVIMYGGLTGPNSLYKVDCGEGYCIGIVPTTYGLTAFGSNPATGVFTVPGITGVTAVSVTHYHAVALKDNGTVYAWGENGDGQTDVPTGSYTKIAAGKHHSAAIDDENKLVIWGKILKYGDAGCAGQNEEKVTPVGLSGAFSQISSGYDHLVLQGTGTTKKYIGVVESVDTVYKRIFVKTYSFPDTIPVLLEDPAGTIVTVWRYNTPKNNYEQVKSIQNQLLSIQKYLDSTKYISQTGTVVDVGTPNNWLNTYIPNYQDYETNEAFVTLRKELLDIDLYNKTQIKQLSKTGVINLENAIKELIENNIDNQIKISDL